jgi:anti-sigma factor RsiW
MALGSVDNALLTRYLLGDISESQREHLEHEYFINNELWSALNAAADDLIDAYVRGELPQNQREQFERHFMASSDRRTRVDFARVLLDANLRSSSAEALAGDAVVPGRDPESAVPVLWKRYSARRLFPAFAAAAMIIAVILLVIQNQRLRSEFKKVQWEQSNQRNQIIEPHQQAQNLGGLPLGDPQFGRGPTISMSLTPGLARGSGSGNGDRVLPVSQVPSTVLLFLSLEHDEYPSYDVAVKTAEGKEILRAEGLKSQPLKDGGKFVAIRLSSQLLSADDYIVSLSGKSTNDKAQLVHLYSFTAAK